MPRRFGCFLFRSRKPKSQYKRSFWEDIWPGRPQLGFTFGSNPTRVPLLAIARFVLLFFKTSRTVLLVRALAA